MTAIAASPIAHLATRAHTPSTPPSLADETPPWHTSSVCANLFPPEVVESAPPTPVPSIPSTAPHDHAYFQVRDPSAGISSARVPPQANHHSSSSPSCEAINSSPFGTVRHVPKKCRNFFSRSLCSVIENLIISPSLDTYTDLHALAKCTLSNPARGGRQHGEQFVKIVNARLSRWDNGERLLPKNETGSRRCKRQRDPSPESDLAKRNRLVIRATQDGQYGKAAKILSSSGLASPSKASVQAEMLRLHPFASLPIIPDEECPPPTSFSEDDVLSAIRSFPEGTAAGPSGFRLAFLKDSVSCPNLRQGAFTRSAVTKLVNIVAAGKLTRDIAPFFCGAQLHALHKKDANSLRPIAVGETFRRLVAKCLAFKLSPQASTFLEPHQLGVKTRGGCEAIIHAAQAILSDPSLHENEKWVLQVDFRNAFNTMDRGFMLSEVRKNLPGLSAFAEWCYGDHSILQFGETTIASASGPQQGDPLGCILFALGLHPLVKRIQAEVPTLNMHTWYLDDGTFIGRLLDIAKAFQIVKDFSPIMGLWVSMVKSTYWRSPKI